MSIFVVPAFNSKFGLIPGVGEFHYVWPLFLAQTKGISKFEYTGRNPELRVKTIWDFFFGLTIEHNFDVFLFKSFQIK